MAQASAAAASAAMRPRVRQVDIVEFFSANRPALKEVTTERRKMEKGVLCYLRDGAEFIRDMRAEKKKEPETDKPAEKKGQSTVDQYYASQDLLKRMKWKRVTWDDDADFDNLSRRILDNDSVFNKVPAFSHMSLHIVRDKAARATPVLDSSDRQVTSIKAGSLTKWFLEERAPEAAPAAFAPPPKVRQAPFTIDWEAGTVRVLDSASLQELLVYLATAAPRVQALQQRMEEEQTKIAEEMDGMRVRLGATVIKFNKYDKAFWDDPERLKDPENYVTPAEVRQFLDAADKRSTLLRKYVRDNQVRIVRAGMPYVIDPVEKEIRIPANFAEYNFLPIHGRYESWERMANMFRKTALVWFFVGMMLVGDLEVL